MYSVHLVNWYDALHFLGSVTIYDLMGRDHETLVDELR